MPFPMHSLILIKTFLSFSGLFFAITTQASSYKNFMVTKFSVFFTNKNHTFITAAMRRLHLVEV
ncbi:MAG: hypothetical protein CK425_04595 [Parachlamydia sp.]|nr:MAG: hypothetical protein CK425_04595 [Parachlamydia sp.]